MLFLQWHRRDGVMLTSHPPPQSRAKKLAAQPILVAPKGGTGRQAWLGCWYVAHKVTNSHTDWIMVVNRIGDSAAWPAGGQACSRCCPRPLQSHVCIAIVVYHPCQSSSVTAIAFKVFTLWMSLPSLTLFLFHSLAFDHSLWILKWAQIFWAGSV